MPIFLRRIFELLHRQGTLAVRIGQALALAALMNVAFGTAYWFAERGAQPDLGYTDALWWAMVTMTTVGYGDYSATTAVGRFLVAYPTFILGIGLLGYLLGAVAEAVIERASVRRRGAMTITAREHVLICNCPNPDKVLAVLDELRAAETGDDCVYVLVTDRFEALPERLRAARLEFVYGRPIDEAVLRQANVVEASGVIVLAKHPDDPETDAQTFAVGSVVELIEREVRRPIRTVVEIVNHANAHLMRRGRIDGVVAQDGVGDRMLVQEFLHPGLYAVFAQLLSNREGSRFHVIAADELSGQRFRDVQRAALDVDAQVVGIVRGEERMLNPPADLTVQTGDAVILLATEADRLQAVRARLAR